MGLRSKAIAGAVLVATMAASGGVASAHDSFGDDHRRQVHGKTLALHDDPKPPVPLAAAAEETSPISAPLAELSSGLPATWCGGERTTDDTANESGASQSKFKVIYAYPTDVGNRFTAFADFIQRYVGAMGARVANATGGQRTMRFDMGTSCGPNYVDIQTVALKSPRSTYYNGAQPELAKVESELLAAGGFALGSPNASKPRNILAYLDGLRATTSSYVSGEAYRYIGSTGSDAQHNKGGLVSVVYGPQGSPPTAGSALRTDLLTTYLHESFHNMGAVQDDSPNSSKNGHCTDENDVMCYADGGTGGPLRFVCPLGAGLEAEALDCNSDDYLGTAPASGSYLATHWNIFRSALLVPCSEAPLACGSDGGTPAPAPPTVVTGSASAISQTGASVAGTVNPNGKATSYRFEYGTTTSYGQRSPATDADAGAGSAAQGVSASLTGLTAGTLYHYRLVATNADGTTNGLDGTFTTTAAAPAPRAPTVVTSPASPVGSTSAYMRGTVNPNGIATSYRFEYGTSTSYDRRAPASDVSAGAGTVARAVTTGVGGLTAGTTYHFRIVAVSSAGTSYGADQAFTTTGTAPAPATPPAVVTGAASSVVQTTASIAGTVNPNGRATTYRFEYGTTTSYGQRSPASDASAGSGTTAQNVSATLSGLTAATTYHYRVVATNSAGTTNGTDRTFTTTGTTPPPPPSGGSAFPTTLTYYAGTAAGGSASSLGADDGSYLSVQSSTGTPTTDYYGRIPGVPNGAASLQITYSGFSTAPCTQTLAVYSWSRGWIGLDTRTSDASETAVTVTPSGTAADWVSGTTGNGDVVVRVRCVGSAAFISRGDLMQVDFSG